MTRRPVLLAIIVVVVAVVVAGLFAIRRSPSTPENAGPGAAPNVVLATARSGSVEEQIDVQGRVGPPAGSSAKIAFAQPGIVRAIDVRVGQHVSAGEKVAELDRATLAAALEQAGADVRAAGLGTPGGGNTAASSAAAKLAVANARLQTLQSGGPAATSSEIAAAAAARQAALKVSADEAALARAQTLFDAGVLAAKDVDAARVQLASDRADERSADARVASAVTDYRAALAQARADVASARNDVQSVTGTAASAQARLDAARIAYANGVLRAPADGVVLAVLKHPGESVDVTQPVLEIGPALADAVTLQVAADSARRVAVGDAVTLHVPQSHQPTTSGHVIAVVPVVDPTTQVTTVVVDGAPPDAVPGDAVTATIVVGRFAGVVIPTSAIVQDPQTGKNVVFVQNAHPKPGDSGFTLREVAVGATNADRTAIASGLRAGERVAAQGGYTLLAPAGGG